MPRTDYDEVFNRDGNLLSSTPREVSDEEIELEQDRPNLEALIVLAQTAERDWTNADVVKAVRLLLRQELRQGLRQNLP